MNIIQGYPPPQKDYYKVYVQTCTYNQTPYIEDCLNGAAMQETNFPFVHHVIDDASTDGEQKVIKAWMDKNCDMEHAEYYDNDICSITIVKNKNNPNCTLASYFLKRNMFNNPQKKELYIPWENACEYEALCEGDDYWTDTKKLQKQVDIMDADKSLMGCCSSCSVVDKNGNILEKKGKGPVVKDNKEGRYNLRDFFDQAHKYPTASVLFRLNHANEVAQKCKIMSNPYMGDWSLWVALLCFGDFYYIDEVMTAYRINPTSLTHSGVDKRRLGQAKDNFRLIPCVASVLPEEYEDIKKRLLNDTAWMWFALANAYKHVHKYIPMIYCLIRCELKDFGYVRKQIR